MKPLTKKLLESGIIGRTTSVLLERWGSLTPEEVGQLNQKRVMTETMEVFIEELELLLQPEALEKDIVKLDQKP